MECGWGGGFGVWVWVWKRFLSTIRRYPSFFEVVSRGSDEGALDNVSGRGLIQNGR